MREKSKKRRHAAFFFLRKETQSQNATDQKEEDEHHQKNTCVKIFAFPRTSHRPPNKIPTSESAPPSTPGSPLPLPPPLVQLLLIFLHAARR
jgi:hypothetical protein